MDSELYEKMPPLKLFFRCAVPAVITSVVGALYSIEDGIVVGKYLGEDALAAINLIMPIIMIVEALSNMIATGSSVNISILLGQKKRDEASNVFSFSIRFILICSCILSVCGYVFARQFIELISPGATQEAIRLSTEYLKMYSLFGPLIPVYFATDNYLRVCGKEKESMIINVVTQILNVLIDVVLVILLHHGVRAAAFSSCISIVLGSVVTLYMFSGKKMDLYYTKERIPLAQFFRIAGNGFSEFFSSIAASIMSVIMNLFLLKYGGTTAVAAFSVVMYVDSIIGMMNFGTIDSLQPAISYCYGAGLIDRMKKIFKIVIIATVTTSTIAFLFMLFVGPHVAGIFVREGDTELLEMSITAIKIFSFSYLIGWIDMCFSSFFTAVEKPVRSLVLSLFGTLVFPVVFLSMLTSLYGLNGIWAMSSASAAASGILALILVKTLSLQQGI